MENHTFITLVQWVISHGYFLFFISAVLEGPLVTAAAGVAAALGYYSLYIIIALSVFGDLVADTVYYSIGYWSRKALIKRYGPYVGLTKERVGKLDSLLHRHTGKALVIIKLSPAIPIPGLIMVGSARVPLKKFVRIALLITLPKSILFALVGFFAGRAYERFSGVIANAESLFTLIACSIIVIYLAYQKLTARIAKEIK